MKFEIGMVLSLLVIVSPIIITGIVFHNSPSYLELCKYIPFNHGNYNYYYVSKYTFYGTSITYSVFPHYKYVFSFICQMIELVISVVGLMCIINRKDLLGVVTKEVYNYVLFNNLDINEEDKEYLISKKKIKKICHY